MTLKERFLDYLSDSGKYNLSIFEQIIYGVLLALGIFLMIIVGVVLIVTVPVWCIPYLIYKKHQIVKENEHDRE